MNPGAVDRDWLRRAGYEIEAEIGRGASGVVYSASQVLLGRRVALKRVRVDSRGASSSARRLEREVAALVALDHPGVVRLLDVLRQPQELWFVMEYIDGPTLRQVLDATPDGLAAPDALAIIEQLAAVLDHVSARGIVHRDLKPSNVFLTAEGRSKVGDFGIARLSDAADPRVTNPGVVIGTPAYLSPEQASGASEPTPASDRYSLGVIAYELLVGQVPFTRPGNVLALLAAHESESPPAPRSLRPELTAAVESVLLAPLAKDPHKRPGSAPEFFSQLERVAEDAWPGWRRDVNLVRPARPVVPAPPSQSDETLTSALEPPVVLETHRPVPASPPPVPPPEPAPKPHIRHPSRLVLPVMVFVVAVAGSFLAVRAITAQGGNGGGGLRVESIELNCSSGRVTATVGTNGKSGVLAYRWSTGRTGSLMIRGQRAVLLTDQLGQPTEQGLTGPPVIFYLISPETRQKSLPEPAGC